MSTSNLAWYKSSYSGSESGDCIEVAVTWHKSSYSSSESGDCVEVAVTWHKSSHSSESGDDCVEVATCPEAVHVRDSKDKTGPHLTFTPDAWAAFVAYARNAAA